MCRLCCARVHIVHHHKVKEVEQRGAKIGALEHSLAALVAEFEAQRSADAAAHDAQLQAASRDVDALRRLAQLQAGQLSKARQVAKAALRGRTRVERFLLAGIEQAAAASAAEATGDAGPALAALCAGRLDVAVCVLSWINTPPQTCHRTCHGHIGSRCCGCCLPTSTGRWRCLHWRRWRGPLTWHHVPPRMPMSSRKRPTRRERQCKTCCMALEGCRSCAE